MMSDEQLEQHRQVALKALQSAQHPLADSVWQMLLESGRMRSEIQEIKHALVGNVAMGHKGLVGRVDMLEGKVENLDGLVKKGGGVVLGVTTVVEIIRQFKVWVMMGVLVLLVVWLAACRSVQVANLTPEQIAEGEANLELPVGWVWEVGKAVRK